MSSRHGGYMTLELQYNAWREVRGWGIGWGIGFVNRDRDLVSFDGNFLLLFYYYWYLFFAGQIHLCLNESAKLECKHSSLKRREQRIYTYTYNLSDLNSYLSRWQPTLKLSWNHVTFDYSTLVVNQRWKISLAARDIYYFRGELKQLSRTLMI